jgi:hypothetical protein
MFNYKLASYSLYSTFYTYSLYFASNPLKYTKTSLTYAK